MILFIAILAMAVSEVLDAFMDVFEAANRPLWAGIAGAGDNTLGWLVAILGADTFIAHGLRQTIVFGASIFITSFLATALATRWANRLI